MLIFRAIGIFLICIVLMLLGADVVSTLENTSGTTIRSFAQILMLLGPDPQPWIERLPPFLAGVLLAVLSWPGWAVLAVPGVLLAMTGSSRNKGRAPPPPPPPYRPAGR